jgi:hypothetical protein
MYTKPKSEIVIRLSIPSLDASETLAGADWPKDLIVARECSAWEGRARHVLPEKTKGNSRSKIGKLEGASEKTRQFYKSMILGKLRRFS